MVLDLKIHPKPKLENAQPNMRIINKCPPPCRLPVQLLVMPGGIPGALASEGTK